MTSLRILYLGSNDPGSTSYHRGRALQRLGHEVVYVDPAMSLGPWSNPTARAVNYRLGFSLSQSRTQDWLRGQLRSISHRFDVGWVDGGELLGRNCVGVLSSICHKLVLFNHDDPSGSRDHARFRSLRKSISAYDLCAVVRPFNVPELFALGARDVVQVWRGYDEVAHRPADPLRPVPEIFRSDIAFIGWRQEAENRDYLISNLIDAGLKPAIWGGNWQRSPLWAKLKPFWRGGYIAGQDYVDAIRGSQICLGLLSKANRDEHTTRSMEIPYAGGLLCAERTPEHQMLYEEGQEAVFWSNAKECVDLCKRLLADDATRDRIRAAGQRRVLANRVGNEDLCRHVLDHLSRGERGFLIRVPGVPVPALNRKVFFFDSHPVQYKAPVYQSLQKILPDTFEVIYATDASAKPDKLDEGFGVRFAWDIPLLEGYRYRVLNSVRGVPLTGTRSLTGKGVFSLIRKERPRATVLVQSTYLYDAASFFASLVLRVPMILRQETQDEMFRQQRSKLKSLARLVLYHLYYAPIRHALAFGELNRQHLLRHGFRPQHISMAHFSVPNPLQSLTLDERSKIREDLRKRLNVPASNTVLAFFGKFIPKKNPDILFHCLRHLPPSTREHLTLLFVGAGELKSELDGLAAEARETLGVASIFTGFINQRELPQYYLGSDIVALPSRPMGEAWGLVINEALQAGCSVIMSTAVGCAPEFAQLERARVIEVEDDVGLARAVEELARFPRSLDWAWEFMQQYSTEEAAINIAGVLRRY